MKSVECAQDRGNRLQSASQYVRCKLDERDAREEPPNRFAMTTGKAARVNPRP